MNLEIKTSYTFTPGGEILTVTFSTSKTWVTWKPVNKYGSILIDELCGKPKYQAVYTEADVVQILITGHKSLSS